MQTGVAVAAAVVLVGGCAAVAPSADPSRWVEPVTGMTFARLPAGQFVMGSPEDEPGRESQEVPHVVRFSRPTWMALHEVTQGQWRAVMGTDRGGSWAFSADNARCALRYTHRPRDVGYSLGFRVVRDVATPSPAR